MNINQLRPRSRFRSFGYALKGLRTLFDGEPNAWIHLAAASGVVVGAWVLDFTASEWVLILFAIGIVFAAEALNSAIEALCDYACKEHNELIGRSKDLAAAGVLIAALTAATIGLILFVPKILAIFS